MIAQAFQLSDVESPDSATDFTNVQDNTVNIVKGRGQVVEWKLSSVTVIEKEDVGNKKNTPLKNNMNGSLRVKTNWELYIVGGKFVERDE